MPLCQTQAHLSLRLLPRSWKGIHHIPSHLEPDVIWHGEKNNNHVTCIFFGTIHRCLVGVPVFFSEWRHRCTAGLASYVGQQLRSRGRRLRMPHSRRRVSIRLQSVLTLAAQIWALAYGPHGHAKYSAFDLISSEVAPKVPSAAEWAEPVVDPWCRSLIFLGSLSTVGARGELPAGIRDADQFPRWELDFPHSAFFTLLCS